MSTPLDQLPSLSSIGAALHTQDNRCTADPIFLVERRERFYGVDLDYADHTVWMHIDGDEVTDEKEIERLEELEDSDPDHYQVGYLDRWVYVMPFFTEAGAQAYIEENRHRHDDGALRIYVDCAYRNAEWQAVRSYLMNLAAPL